MVPELIIQYGPFMGLFLSSLIGSTVFIPFSVEIVLAGLVRLGLNPYLLVFIASIGSLTGTCINYALGYMGSELIKRKVDGDKIGRAKKLMDKYGWPGLFLIIALPIPLPIPVDPITLFPGIARMNFFEFIIIIFLAKLVRYSFFIGLLSSLLDMPPS